MNKANKPITNQPAGIDEVIGNLRALRTSTTQGVWSKGDTSHETIAVSPEGKEYHIASFRHADDASFVDYAHTHVPALLNEIERLRAEVLELKKSLD